MICNQGHPRSVTPCSICVIHIPCACSLESSSFHIVPRITHCQPSKSLKPVHGVNLVYLKTFSDDVDINTLSGSTTFGGQPRYDTATIEIANSTLKSVVDQNERFHMDFKKIANNVKANNENYQTTADYLLQSTFDLSKSAFSYSLSSILQIVLLVYMGVSFLVLVYLLFRIRYLTLTVMMLAHPVVVHSWHHDPIPVPTAQISMSTFERTHPRPDSNTYDRVGSYFEMYATRILLVMAFLYVVFQLVKLFRKIFEKYSTAHVAGGGRHDLIDQIDPDDSGPATLTRSPDISVENLENLFREPDNYVTVTSNSQQPPSSIILF